MIEINPKSIAIFENKYGKIDPSLLGELQSGRINMSQLFEQVAHGKGKGKSYHSGENEGEIGSLMLTPQHCRRNNRPRGSVRTIRGR